MLYPVAAYPTGNNSDSPASIPVSCPDSRRGAGFRWLPANGRQAGGASTPPVGTLAILYFGISYSIVFQLYQQR